MKQKSKRDLGTGSAEQIAELALSNATSEHVVIGPIVWLPSDGTSARLFYFTIASCDRGGFRLHKIVVAEDTAEQDQRDIVAALSCRQAVVVHLVDDELAMARLCEKLWPSPRITALRRAVEVEEESAAKIVSNEARIEAQRE
jgi:hypothetical protein